MHIMRISRTSQFETQCMLAGEAFNVFKAFTEKVVKHPETGKRQTIRKRKAVRSWYYNSNNHHYFEIKVGLKSMELDKGKTAIDVGPKENLLEVISTIIKAVEKGELDTHILALSPPKAPKLRNRTKKTV